MVEEPKPEVNEISDYDKLDSNDDLLTPVVESEYDLKALMLSSSFRDKDVFKLHDLLLKELTLSNIPDTELASIYAGKLDCIEAWISMGWHDMAKSRLVRLLFRLQLLRSVQGHESDRQHGHIVTTSNIEREPIERYSQEEEQRQGGNPILPKITNMIRKRR